jgi:molybdate transport system ATP-binding protein
MRHFALDADWSIGNELAVLFGGSGAGKTLTLHMLAGLMAPDAGRIEIGGNVFFDAQARINVAPQRRALGYVFQDLALFPHMTVADNILFGAHGMERAESCQRSRALIEQFGLRGQERKLPHEISGGQKQRVAFARALMRRPAALLLDEPFSALDRPLRLDMQNVLKQARQSLGIPAILVTHDLNEALTLADKLIVYAGGTVVQSGTAAEVVGAPACRDVAMLMAGHSGPSSLFKG